MLIKSIGKQQNSKATKKSFKNSSDKIWKITSFSLSSNPIYNLE